MTIDNFQAAECIAAAVIVPLVISLRAAFGAVHNYLQSRRLQESNPQ